MHLLVIRSSEAHSRRRECLLSVDQASVPQICVWILFRSLGRACIESAPPHHRRPCGRQRGVATSCRVFLEAEGTHRSAGYSAERAFLFVGRFVDRPSLTDKRAGRQYRYADADGRKCLGVRISDQSMSASAAWAPAAMGPKLLKNIRSKCAW